jgi:biotin carboxylase
VIEAAKKTGAKYVHPGYGFLSERPQFVEACEKAGLIFVGPTAQSMRLMGDKIEARKTMDALKVPRVPGSIAGAGRAGGRVAPGMRMAGRMGNERVTVKNLRILQVDKETNTIVISGAVPGRPGTLVEIRG